MDHAFFGGLRSDPQGRVLWLFPGEAIMGRLVRKFGATAVLGWLVWFAVQTPVQARVADRVTVTHRRSASRQARASHRTRSRHGSFGSRRHRRHAGTHAKRVCAHTRYGCVGHKPTYYDQFVRVIRHPLRGYDRACIKRLRRARVKFRILTRVKGVRTPIEVLSKRIGGVNYIKHWSNKRRFILDCHTVEVLDVAGRAIRRAGVASIYYSSTWRYTYLGGTHRFSQHAFGRAMDIPAIDGAFGYATTIHHYERGIVGCGAKNHTSKGAAWRKFCCALKLNHYFNRILTPDTNRDHHDHLHIEGPSRSVHLAERPRRLRAVEGRRRHSVRGRAHGRGMHRRPAHGRGMHRRPAHRTRSSR
ncbi:MAG: extensin family protein [Deltaproteobacteria bacterium]|nr:extensin family protein [Deltaproteobacteria bacterium]